MTHTITAKIPDEIWDKFRIKVRKKYGREYGYIEKAIILALKEWVKHAN
jgi:hypothetical protein